MARNFAKLVAQSKDPIGTAVLRAHGKPPTEEERSLMTRFLKAQIESYGGDKESALVDFCHALLASNEMIYVQ